MLKYGPYLPHPKCHLFLILSLYTGLDLSNKHGFFPPSEFTFPPHRATY